MPEETKKKQQKGRSDPKEQRRPRQRNQPGPVEKKVDKKDDESKAPQKPVFEEPGPEFYKNLKRETDEILKITEEENSKYKKKEIQSNWSKYEMPIDSYDEIQEQENMGADYEKLIEAPLSVGGYFQFKHEKSWDLDNAGPSPYDKYFEMNMDSLFLSISAVPFYERNNIEKDIFTETDVLNMNNRATRFKQKYYNDKSFETPAMEIQNSITPQSSSNTSEEYDLCIVKDDTENKKETVLVKPTTEKRSASLENNIIPKVENDKGMFDSQIILETKVIRPEINTEYTGISKPFSDEEPETTTKKCDESDKVDEINVKDIEAKELCKTELPISTSVEKETEKPPIIESPEDLEKWLDDFLDG